MLESPEDKKKKEEEPKWLDNKYNYGANDQEVMEIQERVQARYKNKKFRDGILDGIKKSGMVKPEMEDSALVLSFYMYTAYEVGKEAGLSDVSTLIEKTLGESMKESMENGIKK